MSVMGISMSGGGGGEGAMARGKGDGGEDVVGCEGDDAWGVHGGWRGGWCSWLHVGKVSGGDYGK